MTLETTGEPADTTVQPPDQLSSSQYIEGLIQSGASAIWPRRYEMIDELTQIYTDQRNRANAGETRIERTLYALLADRTQAAARHQMILLTTARFVQMDAQSGGSAATTTSADAFDALDIEATASERRTRGLMDRRSVRRDATVHHLLPAALALHKQKPELLQQTLDRWLAQGSDVTDIARTLQRVLNEYDRRAARSRAGRRLFAALIWIAVLLAPFFFTMVLCANLYTDHLLIFLRHMIY